MGNKTSFQKGNISWNKNLKGIHLSPNSEFKADGSNAGKLHNSWKGGVQTRTNDCTYLWTATNQRARRPRLVYEQNFGVIPEGYVVIHIDGDKDNDDANNLLAISRSENLKRNLDNKKTKI